MLKWSGIDDQLPDMRIQKYFTRPGVFKPRGLPQVKKGGAVGMVIFRYFILVISA